VGVRGVVWEGRGKEGAVVFCFGRGGGGGRAIKGEGGKEESGRSRGGGKANSAVKASFSQHHPRPTLHQPHTPPPSSHPNPLLSRNASKSAAAGAAPTREGRDSSPSSGVLAADSELAQRLRKIQAAQQQQLG